MPRSRNREWVLPVCRRAMAWLPARWVLVLLALTALSVTYMADLWSVELLFVDREQGRSATVLPPPPPVKTPASTPRSLAFHSPPEASHWRKPNVSSTLSKPSAQLSAPGYHHQHQMPATLSTVERVSYKAFLSKLPEFHASGIDCVKLFKNDKEELRQAGLYQRQNPKMIIPSSHYEALASNCDSFLRTRKYILTPVSEEEARFPIAFSLVVFKDVEQFERLLRVIYRPQNYYCVHIDKKADLPTVSALTALVRCFKNVFMASRSVDVMWGTYSVLEPELVCMEDLWKYKKWKYFINLTGQEFPLKTNLDLVQILQAFNGANSMEGTVKRRNRERTEYVYNGFLKTNKRKPAPPQGVLLTKGSVHVAASRAFVDYVLHNSVALQFREWIKTTGVPDETFFSSLNHSPLLKVPGAYTGDPETSLDKYPFIARFKNWGDEPFNWPCRGQRVRMVCVFGVGDLLLLAGRPEMFANKFYLDYEPLALDCMEELLLNRTRDEVAGTLVFNVTTFASLSFAKHHV